MAYDNPILAIIGTAGRGDDAKKLTLELWNDAKRLVLKFIEEHGVTYLISGGAAFADSLAPEAFLSPKVKQISKLILALPCEFDLEYCQFADNGEQNFQTNPGGTCNYYHKLYSKVLGKSSLEVLRNAIIIPQTETIVGNGFFDRNAIVADRADILLAITFGNQEVIKDGGTAHTAGLFIKKNGGGSAYHLNLNDLKIYKNARVNK